jgi:Ser/Thr protein kinase RdoA (MazF antagonist)
MRTPANITPIPAEQLAAIDWLLPRYSARRLGPTNRVPDSVLNENYRVESTIGPLFVRIHRSTATLEAVAFEHRLIGWAGERGIPVLPPLATRDGFTVSACGANVMSVFPWRPWRTLTRQSMDAGGAAVLGAMLGRLHATLASFADETLREPSAPALLDTLRAATELRLVAARVRDEPALPVERQSLLTAIGRQLQLLEATRPDTAFSRLPCQPIHGDYHNRNVLIDADGMVAAVIDWEMAQRSWRIYELLRCLTHSELVYTPALVRSFAEEYRRHMALSADECAVGVELWWQLRLHSTWVYRTRFLEGDRRVGQFLASAAPFFARFADPAARADLGKLLYAAAA